MKTADEPLLSRTLDLAVDKILKSCDPDDAVHVLRLQFIFIGLFATRFAHVPFTTTTFCTHISHNYVQHVGGKSMLNWHQE